MEQTLALLELALSETPRMFRSMAPKDLMSRRAPGAWSAQEVLGHLIDSALNNLQRFTLAQAGSGPFAVTPYPQDHLVRANAYNELPVEHLLALWTALNRQIIEVIRRIPDQTARRQVILPDGDASHDLGWLIADYAAHMRGHLDKLSTVPVA